MISKKWEFLRTKIDELKKWKTNLYSFILIWSEIAHIITTIERSIRKFTQFIFIILIWKCLKNNRWQHLHRKHEFVYVFRYFCYVFQFQIDSLNMTEFTIDRSLKKFKTSNFLSETFKIFFFSFNANFSSVFIFFIHAVENFFSIFDLSTSSFSSIFSIFVSFSTNLFFFRTNFYISFITLFNLDVIDFLFRLSFITFFNVRSARDTSKFFNFKFSSFFSLTFVISLNKSFVSFFFFATTVFNDDFLISFFLLTFADSFHVKISSLIRRTFATFSDSRFFRYSLASLISATFFDDRSARFSFVSLISAISSDDKSANLFLVSSIAAIFSDDESVCFSLVSSISAISSVDKFIHFFFVSLTSATISDNKRVQFFDNKSIHFLNNNSAHFSLASSISATNYHDKSIRFFRLTSAAQCSVNVRLLLVNDFLLKRRTALNFSSSLNDLNIRNAVDRYQTYIQNVIIDINFVCVSCDLFINNQQSHQLFIIDEIYQNCVKLNLFDETELNCCETTTSIYSFCTLCFDNFSKSRISKFESINQMNSIACQNFSDALKNLTLIEEIVIAKIHFFISILKLRFNDITAVTFYQRIRDHAVILSQNSDFLLDILSSKNLMLHDVIKIIWISKRSYTESNIRSFTRVKKNNVLKAFIWLKNHNCLYKNININQNIINEWNNEFVSFKLIDRIVQCESDSTEKNEYAANLINDNHENDFHHAISEIDVDQSELLSSCVYTDVNDIRNKLIMKLINVVTNYKKNLRFKNDLNTSILTYQNHDRSISFNDWKNSHYFTTTFSTLFFYDTDDHFVNSKSFKTIFLSFDVWIKWALLHHSRRQISYWHHVSLIDFFQICSSFYIHVFRIRRHKSTSCCFRILFISQNSILKEDSWSNKCYYFFTVWKCCQRNQIYW